MNTFVWCEDKGSGYTFWSNIFGIMHADFIVESKKNNAELRKSVSKIESEEDEYYILMDYAVDNPDVFRETQRLHAEAGKRQNVHVVCVHSFEFVLLSFKKLEDWVFAGEDSLREKRAGLLQARDLFVDVMTGAGDMQQVSVLNEFAWFSGSSNFEQISAKLLFEITRNTGFETTKGKLGDCFIVDCCGWDARMDDDICGLDDARPTRPEKAKEIIENSILREAFLKAGL